MDSAHPALDRILGVSKAIRIVRERVCLLAPTRVRIHIQGETGTGKELVAEAIHRLSKFAAGPFVAINGAELLPDLASSQLFGHREGSFTGSKDQPGAFDLAAQGTLLLDEAADLRLDVQAMLLRALEEGVFRPIGGDPKPVRCRIITATHRSLDELEREGRFRRDLRERLAVDTIVLPPLRERPEDLDLLARTFLERAAAENEIAPATLPPAAMAVLRRHTWPRNVRELRNTMTSLAVSCAGRPVAAADVHKRIATDSPRLDDREWLIGLLSETRGNVTAAALRAGVRRQSFHRLMVRHGIPPGTGRARRGA